MWNPIDRYGAYAHGRLRVSACVQAVEAQAFYDWSKSSFPNDAQAMQRFIREKGHVEGDPPRLAMYYHEYTYVCLPSVDNVYIMRLTATTSSCAHVKQPCGG